MTTHVTIFDDYWYDLLADRSVGKDIPFRPRGASFLAQSFDTFWESSRCWCWRTSANWHCADSVHWWVTTRSNLTKLSNNAPYSRRTISIDVNEERGTPLTEFWLLRVSKDSPISFPTWDQFPFTLIMDMLEEYGKWGKQRLTLCLCGKRRWSEGQGASRKDAPWKEKKKKK